MNQDAKKLCLQKGILEKWHDKEYDDFDNDLGALEKIRKYEGKYKSAKVDGVGLYLFGSPGVGKTMLMNVLFKHLLLDYKQTVRVVPLETLIHKYINYREAEDGFNDFVRKTSFLCVEGMGKEYKSGNNDMALLVMDLVFQFRSQMKLPTCLTTNIPPKDIGKIYSHDFASLLNECMLIIEVQGQDYRTNHINEEIKRKYLGKDVR